MKGKTVCRLHGARGGAPKGEANGSFKHGGWTSEAVKLRRAARRLLKQVGKETAVTIDEVLAKRERRLAGEQLPYTRAEAQALMAYTRRTIKERAGTRRERSAANKKGLGCG